MLRKAGQEEGAINIEAAYVTSFFFFYLVGLLAKLVFLDLVRGFVLAT